MISEQLKKIIIEKYKSTNGSEKLYKYLIAFSIEKISNKKDIKNYISPELDLIDFYDSFLILFRRTGEEEFLEIAKICRKVAHKIYRSLFADNIEERNIKFLNLVKKNGSY